MAGDRYVLLGLAHPRSAWFRTLAQWTNAASIPAELVKCVSPEELRARIRSGRPYSALIIDSHLPALDRDLIETAHRLGCAVIVVNERRGSRDWVTLGAEASLPGDFDRRALMDALTTANRIRRADAMPAALDPDIVPTWRGKLVMVCGPGGTGASTAAMALTQGLASDIRNRGMVVLADLARRAQQGMLHDVGDVSPSVQELVEVHRSSQLGTEDVRGMTFAVAGRGYHLLLGMRRATAWSTLRPRAFDAALAGLCASFRVVVCDADADLEGEAEGGSVDIEERNVMARATASVADLVFVVGAPGVKGVHSLVHVIGDLMAFGVAPGVIVPVINRSPRSHRARTELHRALDTLLPAPDELQPTVHLPDRKVDHAIRDRTALPASMAELLRDAYTSALGPVTRDSRRRRRSKASQITPITPGSLGVAGDDTESAVG